MGLIQRKIHLVGSSPNGAEHLGLSQVAGALKQAGYRSMIHLFRGTADMVQLAKTLAKSKGLFIGISIPSGEASLDLLVFVALLRKNGYGGHICAGGAFATLGRQTLLRRHSIDSVVRYDGAVPVVGLADALSSKGDLHALVGVSTSRGDGLPVSSVPGEIEEVRTVREIPKKYAGVNSAKIAASRGCFGTCTYCGLRAVRESAAAETGDTCFQGIRRRKVEAVADEMADLYHRQGVRFFHFVDENYLPRSSGKAASLIHRLCDALDARGVEERTVSFMLRADAATPEVMEALDRLGVTRCLLGVESNCDDGLHQLKRGHAPAANRRATDLLDRMDTAYHYNLLLIHPDSTLHTIRNEVDALDQVAGGLVDPFQLNIYEGTDIFHRLKREGRLRGGPLLWHFWPEDPGARKFTEIFHLMRQGNSHFSVLTGYLYDTLGALATLHRLGLLGGDRSHLLSAGRRLAQEHNDLWRHALRGMLHLSEGDASAGEIQRFLKDLERRGAVLILETRDLFKQLERSRGGRIASDIYSTSGVAAAALAIAILAGTGACSRAGDGEGDTDSATAPADTASATETSGLDSDTGSESSTESEGDTETETETDDCTYDDAYGETNDLFWGESIRTECGWECADPRCALELNEDGEAINVLTHPDDWGYGPITQEYIDCVLTVLDGQVFPCIAEHQPVWQSPPVLLE